MSMRPASSCPWGVLVVDGNVETLRFKLELLRQSGYNATGAVHDDIAASIIGAIPFNVVIVSVRTHVPDCLRLVRLARERQPAIRIVAILSAPDPALDAVCSELGATCLAQPLDLPRFQAVVADKVDSAARERRWARKPVVGGFAASMGGCQARVVDISYGGCRLELPEPPATGMPASIEVALLSFGLSVNATLVWARPVDATGPWTCGAALGDADEDTTRAWRLVVDALPAGASLARELDSDWLG